MTRRVPRIGRVLDLVGLLLFLAGAAVYARAWFGLRDMEAFQRADTAPTFAALEHADALSRTGRIGLGLMAAAAVVAVLAALVARRVGRTRAARAASE